MKFLALALLLVVSIEANPLSRQLGTSPDVHILTVNNTDVCQVDGQIYHKYDDLPTNDPCEYCTCQPPGFACQVVKCEYRPECRSLQRSNLCCPQYVCDCEYNGVIYMNGEKINDPTNPCEDCYCETGEVVCSLIVCKEPIGNCSPISTDGRCCPSYDCSQEQKTEKVPEVESKVEVTEDSAVTDIPQHDENESIITERSDVVIIEIPQDVEEKVVVTEAIAVDTDEEEFWSSLLSQVDDKKSQTELKTEVKTNKQNMGVTMKPLSEDVTAQVPIERDNSSPIGNIQSDDPVTVIYPEVSIKEKEVVDNMSRTQLQNHERIEIDTESPVIEENQNHEHSHGDLVHSHSYDHHHEHHHHEDEETAAETTEMSDTRRDEEVSTDTPAAENEIVQKLSKTMLQNVEEKVEAIENPVVREEVESNTEVPDHELNEITANSFRHSLNDNDDAMVETTDVPAVQEDEVDVVMAMDIDINNDVSVTENEIVKKIGKTVLQTGVDEPKEEIIETTEIYETEIEAVTNSFRKDSMDTDTTTVTIDDKKVDEKSDYWLHMMKDDSNKIDESSNIDDVETITARIIDNAENVNELRSEVIEMEEANVEVNTLPTLDESNNVNVMKKEVIELEDVNVEVNTLGTVEPDNVNKFRKEVIEMEKATVEVNTLRTNDELDNVNEMKKEVSELEDVNVEVNTLGTVEPDNVNKFRKEVIEMEEATVEVNTLRTDDEPDIVNEIKKEVSELEDINAEVNTLRNIDEPDSVNELRKEVIEMEEAIIEVNTLGTVDEPVNVNEVKKEIIELEGDNVGLKTLRTSNEPDTVDEAHDEEDSQSPSNIEELKIAENVREETNTDSDVTPLREQTMTVVEDSTNDKRELPTEAEITGLAEHPANSRISAQMAHLARKYGLRPLTIKKKNYDLERQRNSRKQRLNRRVVIRKQMFRPFSFN